VELSRAAVAVWFEGVGRWGFIAGHLAALLQAGSGSLSRTVTGYPEQLRQAAGREQRRNGQWR